MNGVNFTKLIVGLVICAVVFCVTVPFALAEPGSSDKVSLPKGLKGVKIGGVTYISYVNGEKSETEYSEFFVRRAYLTVKKSILPGLSSRITLDTSQDEDGDGAGDMEVRIKYMYANFKFPDFGFVTKPNIEFGIVHTPWLDFEEHINYYRMREKMFIERSGIMNSADFGATFAALIGGELDDNYKKTVNKKYPGRYGSFAFGVYNGGGYHSMEVNQKKVVEGRLTLRPIPDVLPGLQFSGFGVYGHGNKEEVNGELPDWQTYLGKLSYEHQYFTFTAQYMDGKGNQKGKWVDETDHITSLAYNGFSFFGEGKLGSHWRTIGGLDSFDPDVDVEDNEFTRYYVGLGYDFGHHNILLLDYDVKDYAAEGKANDYWYQLTMQLHF